MGLTVDGFDCNSLVIGFDSFEYVGEGAGAEGLGDAVPCDFLEYAICILHCFGVCVDVDVDVGVVITIVVVIVRWMRCLWGRRF